jgi:anaerobic selenocysteine-containing dehydrogenase
MPLDAIPINSARRVRGDPRHPTTDGKLCTKVGRYLDRTYSPDLNSSFANLPAFVAEETTPRLEIHPDDALQRGIATGNVARILNDRGAFTAAACVTERARRGVVVAPSIWWRKLSPGGENANAVTGQASTDLGRAATFYDCLVEVAPAHANDPQPL